MAVTYASRTGKNYYLHTGPKRGGGVQHFFSTKSDGNLAERLPDGFEIYESVNGQVFLRREQPKLIRDDERDCITRGVNANRAGHRYKAEVRGNTLTIHESSSGFCGLERFALPMSQRQLEAIGDRLAHYQPVFRFVLVDPERRLFAPERYCFRGSVEDWISVGSVESIERLASKFLKHLGKDSMFELY